MSPAQGGGNQAGQEKQAGAAAVIHIQTEGRGSSSPGRFSWCPEEICRAPVLVRPIDLEAAEAPAATFDEVGIEATPPRHPEEAPVRRAAGEHEFD